MANCRAALRQTSFPPAPWGPRRNRAHQGSACRPTDEEQPSSFPISGQRSDRPRAATTRSIDRSNSSTLSPCFPHDHTTPSPPAPATRRNSRVARVPSAVDQRAPIEIDCSEIDLVTLVVLAHPPRRVTQLLGHQVRAALDVAGAGPASIRLISGGMQRAARETSRRWPMTDEPVRAGRAGEESRYVPETAVIKIATVLGNHVDNQSTGTRQHETASPGQRTAPLRTRQPTTDVDGRLILHSGVDSPHCPAQVSRRRTRSRRNDAPDPGHRWPTDPYLPESSETSGPSIRFHASMA